MANCCCYSMKVAGQKENVKEFIDVVQNDYSYDCEGNYHGECDRHLSKVFVKKIVACQENKEDECKKEILGHCAWSVYSAMTEGGYYTSRYKKEYGQNSHATTLKLESENLQLKIEVFSEESGLGFREHYLYDNGEAILEECIDECDDVAEREFSI